MTPVPVLDLDDLAREVRSLRRQVDTLNRRLADRPPVDEALPLRKVATGAAGSRRPREA